MDTNEKDFQVWALDDDGVTHLIETPTSTLCGRDLQMGVRFGGPLTCEACKSKSR